MAQDAAHPRQVNISVLEHSTTSATEMPAKPRCALGTKGLSELNVIQTSFGKNHLFSLKLRSGKSLNEFFFFFFTNQLSANLEQMDL